MSRTPTIIRDPHEIRSLCDEERARGTSVCLVPTMGALHEGHLKLVREAGNHGDLVVVSIFVNPTQFAPGEDFDLYPRNLVADMNKLIPAGAALVFAPSVETMYPRGAGTSISVNGITEGLCGAHRPGHFTGVATIVAKLFNIVGPCTAIFGRKDYQQLQVIRKMTRDLHLPVKIVSVATVREPDGLAMSSRNKYLSDTERSRAQAIPSGLAAAHVLFDKGERNVKALLRPVISSIEGVSDSVDYITAADPFSLEPIENEALAGETMLIALAVRIGSTRLIDNTVLGEDRSPLSNIGS
jgi:pantoate--beta-alanine ligase